MVADGLQARDIVSLTCTVPPVVASNLTYHSPRTAAEAQFSLHFAIASIVLHGDITLKHLTTIEILRGGLASVSKGQFEAARSLGLSGFALWVKVILPQTFMASIPPLELG